MRPLQWQPILLICSMILEFHIIFERRTKKQKESLTLKNGRFSHAKRYSRSRKFLYLNLLYLMKGRRPESGIISPSPKANSLLVRGKYLIKIMTNLKGIRFRREKLYQILVVSPSLNIINLQTKKTFCERLIVHSWVKKKDLIILGIESYIWVVGIRLWRFFGIKGDWGNYLMPSIYQ